MSINYAPIAIYSDKMSNVLQTDPYIFCTCDKTKVFSNGHIPRTWSFFGGTSPKTKIGACIKIHQYIYLHTWYK